MEAASIECSCGWQGRYMEKALDLQHAEQQIRVMRRAIASLQRDLEEKEGADPRFNDAKDVFEHWRAVVHPGSDRVVFGPKRRKAVLARLKEGHTVDELKRAIDGYAADAYVGENGVRYDDLELICRDETQVAKGVARADAADRRQGIRAQPKLITKLAQAGASPVHDGLHQDIDVPLFAICTGTVRSARCAGRRPAASCRR